MNNYVVEDEVNEYHESRDITISKKKNYRGIIIVLVMIIFIIIFFRGNKTNDYSSLENNMVKKAEEYVLRSNYQGNKEIYIDVVKMNLELPNDCSKLSGVFYKGENYTPYLVCQNYTSKILDDNRIDLVGNKIIFIQKGSNYYELKYKGFEEVDISGKINTNETGVYDVYYISKNSKLYSTRKIVVIDEDNINYLFPTIMAQEEKAIELGQKSNTKVSAYDQIDGDITNKVIEINNVKESEIGEYKVIYSVTNSLGYTTMKSQNVKVFDPLLEETNIFTEVSNENMTNENIKINVKVIGGNYSYMTLPNGQTTDKLEVVYEVDENGTYEFVAVNKDGSDISKKVSIDNIDRTIPTGTCNALLYSNKTNITVTITSFNYVVGYNYVIGNQESGFLSNNNYISKNTTENDIYVIIKDYIGNENKIKCNSSKKNSYDPNGYRTIINGKPRLHIAIAEALAKKGYTINDLNKCIYNRVKEAGPGTRYGVVAAAYGLIDCTYNMTGYVLPYNHTSGKVEGDNYCRFNSDICGKLGVNSKWGTKGGTCSTDKTVQCYHGMNCATFVGWAMCNGGMDMCKKRDAGAYGMASTKYFPEANGVYIKGTQVKYFSGKNLTNYSAEQLVRMIKPGDVIARQRINDIDGSSQHTFVVVGIDNTGIYTANDGYYTEKITYSYMLSGNMSFRILYLDDYYAAAKNRNNLYD